MPKNKYSQQLIIHFDMPEKVMESFAAAKGQHYQRTVPVINLKEMEDKKEINLEVESAIPTAVKGGIRIYLDAHGGPGENTIISSNKREDLSIEALVDTLQPYLSHLTKENYFQNSPRPLISLTVCFAAGTDPNIFETLAANLQRAFAKKGIYLDINGRTSTVAISEFYGKKKFVIDPKDEKKYFELKKLCHEAMENREMKKCIQYSDELLKLMHYHRPNSKYTFVWLQNGNLQNEPEQAVFESYWYRKQEKIFTSLKEHTALLQNILDRMGKDLPTSESMLPEAKGQMYEALFHLKEDLSDLIKQYESLSIRGPKQTEQFKSQALTYLQKAQDELSKYKSKGFDSILFSISKSIGGKNYTREDSSSFFASNFASKTIELAEQIKETVNRIETESEQTLKKK